MNNKARTPIIIALSVVSGLLLGFFLIPGGSTLTVNRNKINQVVSLVNEQYVDKVDMDSLEDEAIRSLLKNLDPHSVYLTSEEIKRENESLQGNFDGIGIQFRIIEDTIVVIQPIASGPSQKAGIMAGDRIIKVDGKTVCGKNITNEEVFKLLKGRKGTKVNISIRRSGIKEPIQYTITRDAIPIHSVDYFGMIDRNTAYIKLSQFSANSHAEVSEAMRKLNLSEQSQLIFDLRGNGGGYLDQAIKIAEEFLEPNDLILFTKGRYTGRKDYFVKADGNFTKGKMIILIDEASASASEIIAGAMQDNDRACIMGRRTFGKGLVQEQKMLADGSAIRLTVSRYYTPSGRCIQRPYISGDPEKYYTDFLERYVNMENHSDTISHADSLKYKTKKGRTVYGGGGIEPDIELPYYLYKKSTDYTTLLRKGLIYKFCFDYTDKNRKEFSIYETGGEFLKNFKTSQDLYDSMIASAKAQKIELKNIPPKEEKEIKLLMKAYMAQNLYGDEYFYPIYLQIDEDVQKCLTQFKNIRN